MEKVDEQKIDGRSKAARSARQESLSETIEREENKGKRSPRVPLEAQGTLDVPHDLKHPDYVYYWEIDYLGKCDRRERAYWEYVYRNGTKVSTPSGDGYTLFLMKLHKDYDAEDKEAERQRLREIENNTSRVKKGEYAGREVGGGDTAIKRTVDVERDLT